MSIRTFSESTDLVRERRDHIRACATALFAQKPYGNCNMREILQACGMSKGGLYYYVGSKDDIRKLIIEHASEAHVDVHRSIRSTISDLSGTDAVRKAIRLLIEWQDEYQDEMIVMNHEIGNLSREERAPLLLSETENVTLLEDILIRGSAAAEFVIDDARLLAHTTHLAVRAWADRRWYLRKLYTLEEYAEKIAASTIAAAGGGVLERGE